MEKNRKILLSKINVIFKNYFYRRKQNEVQVLEDTISRARTERMKNVGVDLDATCEICVKTKFADGVGHICNYCNVRCCARCGGKVSLRSNKVSNSILYFKFLDNAI
jgi:hypothetical protein